MRCIHGELTDGQRTIDDPVVVLHAGGQTADVNLHGGPWVVRSTLDLLAREGFEIVTPAAHSTEYAATDGIDLIEREMLAHLPLALTEDALRTLLSQPEAWRHFVQSSPSREQIQSTLDDRALHWLLHPPRVAIVGVPNVGKSTLANLLFGQQRSITADVPGTTRDWVGDLANVGGMIITLLDTPGVRASDDAIEQAAIARAESEVASADLVICVLDVTQPLETQTDLLLRYPDALRLANKCDLPARWNPSEVADAMTSAKLNYGVDELRRWIASRFDWAGSDHGKCRWWTERQRTALSRAVSEPALLADLIDSPMSGPT